MARSSARRRTLRWPAVVKLLRRVHLYLGLALVPWVLLYGVTAVLFNHSSWLTGRRYTTVLPTAMAWPAADGLAEAAVAGLESPVLVVPGTAEWLGHVHYRGRVEGHAVRAHLSPEDAGGLVRLFPDDPDPPAWAEALEAWEPLSDAEQDRLLALGHGVVAEVTPVESLRVVGYPTLRFEVDDGTRYVVELDLEGDVEVQPVQEAVSWRSRLLRLHTAHGSPGYLGVRWSWARIVDVMGIAMVLWGLTGLIMWWSMPRLRRSGAVALAAGCGSMGLLAAGLWAAMGL